jgi:type IV fimbrial biogenesis protein FimT
MHRPRGYTLLELSIGVAIVAVLLNLAVASYESAVQSARTSAARSALVATLARARTTAAIWGADVAMCPSADGRQCLASDEWHRGWVAFADANDSDTFDPGDSVLVREGPAGDGVRLVTSSGRKYLEFQPNGSNAGSNTTFTFCDRRGRAKATAIAMANVGTYREVKPSASAVERACAAAAAG